MQEAVEVLEKRLISRALELSEGNRSEASKRLGIHRNTLMRKMSDYKLDDPPARRKPPQRVKAVGRRRTRRVAGA